LINAIQNLSFKSQANTTMNTVNSPSTADANQFQNLMSQNSNPTATSLKNFINSAENRLKTHDQQIAEKLKSFNSKDNVASLVEATYLSSMKAVSVEFTSKIGSQVSQSFEQLIKQQ